MAGPRISIPKFLAKLRDNLDFVGSYEPVLGDVITPVFQVDESISGSQPRYLTDPAGVDLETQHGALKVFSDTPGSVIGPDGAHELVLTPNFSGATPTVGYKTLLNAFQVPEDGGRWYWFGDSVLEVSNSFINRNPRTLSTSGQVLSVGVLAIFPSPRGGSQQRTAFHASTKQITTLPQRAWSAFPGEVGNNQTMPSDWILPTQARSSFPTFVPKGNWTLRVGWIVGNVTTTGAAGAGFLLTIPYAAA